MVPGLGDVSRDGQEAAADLLDPFFDLEKALLLVFGLEGDVDADDVKSLTGQGEDDPPADAAAGAGDQCGARAPLQFGRHAHSSSTTIRSLR